MIYRKGPASIPTEAQPAQRPILEIVEQLHELLQIKQSALATAKGDFADSAMFNTISRQEEALCAELRTALGSGPKQRRRKKTG